MPSLDNGYSDLDTTKLPQESNKIVQPSENNSSRSDITRLIEDNNALLSRDFPSSRIGDGNYVGSQKSDEVTYPTKSSYVIGHLPINYETIKSRVSPEILLSPTSKDRAVGKDENAGESTVLSPDKKFSNYKIQVRSLYNEDQWSLWY